MQNAFHVIVRPDYFTKCYWDGHTFSADMREKWVLELIFHNILLIHIFSLCTILYIPVNL